MLSWASLVNTVTVTEGNDYPISEHGHSQQQAQVLRDILVLSLVAVGAF